MDDYRVAVGFLDHPKTRKLKRKIGMHAIEAIMRLWEFATSNQSRRDGNLKHLDAEDIADICRWDGDPDQLVDSLVECGLVEGDPFAYRIHDWIEINPFVASWQERSEKAKLAASARWKRSNAGSMRDACATHAKRNAPSPSPTPIPTPSPSPLPSQTPLSTSQREPDRGSEIRAVFDHYRTYHPRAAKNPKPSGKEWKQIRARLAEGRTVEDLCKAIDGCHKTPHNLGDNDRGEKYLSLALIARDDAHVTRYMENDDNPPRAMTKRERDFKQMDDDFDRLQKDGLL